MHGGEKLLRRPKLQCVMVGFSLSFKLFLFWSKGTKSKKLITNLMQKNKEKNTERTNISELFDKLKVENKEKSLFNDELQ